MKFSYFITTLRENSSHSPSKSDYILEIFAALCGEDDPVVSKILTNPEEYEKKGSLKLPNALRHTDDSYRNKFYNGKTTLTKPIRTHILKHHNKETFTAYLRETVKTKFLNLCKAFEIIEPVKEDDMFEAIYEQFLEFAKTNKDDVDNIIKIYLSSNTEQETTKKSIFKIFKKTFDDCNMIAFINAEPTISYIYDEDDEIENDEIDAEEAYANLISISKELGIEDDDGDEDDDDEDDDDYEEDDDTTYRNKKTATISINKNLIDTLSLFLNTIDRLDLFNINSPEKFKQITLYEIQQIKKLEEFVEILRNYEYIMIFEMETEDGDIWEAIDERMSIMYCETILSCHQQIKNMYDEILKITISMS